MFAIGLFDRPAMPPSDMDRNVTSDAHNQLARELAAQSAVLIQNERQTLPLDANVRMDFMCVVCVRLCSYCFVYLSLSLTLTLFVCVRECL